MHHNQINLMAEIGKTVFTCLWLVFFLNILIYSKGTDLRAKTMSVIKN